jgi:hypothetical protein
MQPPGYIHSQGFLDQARYARYQFRQLGAEVSIGKNRLREDSVNIVFGAHLGFDPSLKQRYTCVFFNLEQLGDGGASVSEHYTNLLRSSPVIDYDERNLAAYGCSKGSTPIVSFEYAPYLATEQSQPLQDRPIDLLFFGSVNERRKTLFKRIEASGCSVSVFDHPLYGEERDQYICQAKAVFNCHFYETSRFEQARAFHTLSLGTPVISERSERTAPPNAFENAVTWVNDDQLESFFQNEFMSKEWIERTQQQLHIFFKTDPREQWRVANEYCQSLWSSIGLENSGKIWRPSAMNLGSGKDYKLGWLNVDILERAEPDLVIDLGQTITLPIQSQTLGGGKILIEKNTLEKIYANNVLEHVPDLPQLMGNLLTLLKEDGTLEVEVPFEKAETAWQDPTHLRAMNKNSWLYYTSWFWYLGWFTHRFEIVQFLWLNEKLESCDELKAAFMKVKLKKVSTTLKERSVARTMRSDFGGIESDLFDIKMPSSSQYCSTGIEANKIVSITEMSFDKTSTNEDQVWLEKIQPAKNVLALGEQACRLKNGYLRKHPCTKWVDIEKDLTNKMITETFDLLLVGPDVAASLDFATKLEQITAYMHPKAKINIALGNASSQQIIDKLIDCDTTNTDIKSSYLHNRETPAHIYKILLDAGWSPSLKGHKTNTSNNKKSTHTNQVKQARDLISTMDYLYIEASRTPQVKKKMSGNALFTVVVPCNQEHQLTINVKASSGLKEVRARVISIQGAHTPGDALSNALRHVETEWILLSHQDVYFPSGFGEQLNAVLNEIPDQEKQYTLLGFAGIGQHQFDKSYEAAGYLTDRLNRFEHGASNKAVSLDEFAIVLHKDSVHKIDPELGWHLWATDLCLTSIKQHKIYPQIICLSIFHNSKTGWEMPLDLQKSARILLKKHIDFSPIKTLCGIFQADAK